MDDRPNLLMGDLESARHDFELAASVLPLDAAAELQMLEKAIKRGDVPAILTYCARLRVYALNTATAVYGGLVDDLGVPRERVEWLGKWLDRAVLGPINPFEFVGEGGASKP